MWKVFRMENFICSVNKDVCEDNPIYRSRRSLALSVRFCSAPFHCNLFAGGCAECGWDGMRAFSRPHSIDFFSAFGINSAEPVVATLFYNIVQLIPRRPRST